MTQAQLDRSVARSTGESVRTVARLGFSALPGGPADPHPEALYLVIDSPCCNGRALFPVMPYMSYRSMSDEDLASVVVYLRSVEPVRNPLPESEIPFPVSRLINSAPEPFPSCVTAPPRQ